MRRSQAKAGMRNTPRSSSHSPETKYRATSDPPETWRPYCCRYPVPSGVASGSLNKLNAVTLSCLQYCASIGARTVCVRKHWTPLFGWELESGLVVLGFVIHPRYAVGYGL